MKFQLSNSKLKLISYVTLFASIAFSIVGQLLMKHTMSNTAEGFFTQSFIQQLALAIITYSLGVMNWVVALRFIKLSVAYPLTSLNYVGILLGSHYFFHEEITLIRVVGVALIFIGVLFVVIPVKNRTVQKGAS